MSDIVPEYINTEDAAKLIGIPKRTLANMRRYKMYTDDPHFTPPPFYRFGRGVALVRYNRVELLAWAKANLSSELEE